VFGQGARPRQIGQDPVRQLTADPQRLWPHRGDQQGDAALGTRYTRRERGGGGEQLAVEVGRAGLGQLPQGGEEFTQPGDRAFEGQAEALRQQFRAQGETEVVPAVGRGLGGLGLAGDQQRVAAEDGDRGGADLQSGHFPSDDRRELG
jgi:hypothetical protein